MAHDPRRRVYIVTVMRHPHETDEQCDIRVMERLHVDTSAAVTLTAYDPLTNEFKKIKPSAKS